MSYGSGTSTSLRTQELRRREGILAKAALLLFLLVGAAVFFVWTRSAVTGLGLKLSELKRLENQAVRRNQMLIVERATLIRVKRIEEYAAGNLGMIYPSPNSIKVIHLAETPPTTKEAGD